MTINDLLTTAINHEVSSQKLYAELQAVVGDPAAVAFLGELVEEEKHHEELLLNVRDLELYDGSIAVSDAIVAQEVEASHGTAPVAVTADSSIEDVLELALRREHRAQQLFLRLAATDVHPELKELFEKLAVEEMQHHHQIQKKFAMHTGTMGYEM